METNPITTFQQAARQLSDNQRNELIDNLMVSISQPLIQTFLILELEKGFESIITNPQTGHVFQFSFSCISKGEVTNTECK